MRGGGGTHHNIGLAQLVPDLIEPDRPALKLRRHLRRPVEVPMGHQHRLDPLTLQVPGRQLRHLPCAQDEDPPALKLPEDRLGQSDGRGWNRDWRVPNPRLRPHLLRHPQGPCHQGVEHRARRRLGPGHVVGCLHLV